MDEGEANKNPRAVGRARGRIAVFAFGIGVTYQDLMEHARKHLEHGGSWTGDYSWMNLEAPPWFWNAYSVVTGTDVVGNEHLPKPYGPLPWCNMFSCSC